MGVKKLNIVVKSSRLANFFVKSSFGIWSKNLSGEKKTGPEIPWKNTFVVNIKQAKITTEYANSKILETSYDENNKSDYKIQDFRQTSRLENRWRTNQNKRISYRFLKIYKEAIKEMAQEFKFENTCGLTKNILTDKNFRCIELQRCMIDHFLSVDDCPQSFYKHEMCWYAGIAYLFGKKLPKIDARTDLTIENKRLTTSEDFGTKINTKQSSDIHYDKSSTADLHVGPINYMHTCQYNNYFDKQFIDWCMKHKKKSLKQLFENIQVYSVLSRCSEQSISLFFIDMQSKMHFVGKVSTDVLWQSITFFIQNFEIGYIDGTLCKILLFLEDTICDIERISANNTLLLTQLFRYVVSVRWQLHKTKATNELNRSSTDKQNNQPFSAVNTKKVFSFSDLKKKFTSEILGISLSSDCILGFYNLTQLIKKQKLGFLVENEILNRGLQMYFHNKCVSNDILESLQVLKLSSANICINCNLDFLCKEDQINQLLVHAKTKFEYKYSSSLLSFNRENKYCNEYTKYILDDLIPLIDIIIYFNVKPLFLKTLLCSVVEIISKLLKTKTYKNLDHKIYILNTASSCFDKLRNLLQDYSPDVIIEFRCALDKEIVKEIKLNRMNNNKITFSELDNKIKHTILRYKGLDFELYKIFKCKLYAQLIDDVTTKNDCKNIVKLGKRFYNNAHNTANMKTNKAMK